MIRFAESYATWLADYYLLALMLLALALATMASLKQPAQRLAIAKSTLVSLVLLAVLCAIPGWSVVHLFATKSPPTIIETHEIVAASPVAIGERPRPAAFAPPTSPMPQASAAESKTVVPKSAFLHQLSWPAIIACTHLVGVAGILGWLLLGWLAALQLRRTAIPAPPIAVEILNRLIATHAQPPRVKLLTHHRIGVPVALGMRRPAIILPPHFIESAIRNPQSEIAPILAHESAHVLNRDLIWVALARAIFLPLWANPLYWFMRRRLRLDQEALADAAAVEVTSRQQYAEQLVAWARDARTRPALHLSSAVGLWEGPSQLRQRIAILLDEQLTILRNCSRRWRLASAAVCGLLAVTLSLVTLQPGKSAPPVDLDAETLSEADSVAVEAAIELLRETKGIGEQTQQMPVGNGRIGAVPVADDWAGAIRTLAEIGSPAVPSIITALDKENRDHAISKLAFTLRAIGDPRAVPALIRAIPRTLFPSRSDYGLRVSDPDLLQFMQKYDLTSGKPGDDFDYGRAFREVVSALHEITGANQADMELNWVQLGGTETQRRIQRKLFQDLAERWDKWWSQNWQKFEVSDTYSRVNLPALKLVGSVVRATTLPQGLTYHLGEGNDGWIIQSAHESKKRCFVDLDTSREGGWPKDIPSIKELGNDRSRILKWADDRGFDMMGITYQPPGADEPRFCLQPIEMKAWQITPDEQRDLPKAIRGEIPYPLKHPVELLIPNPDAELDPHQLDLGGTAFLFLTKEGTAGLLRMTAQVDDTNVTVGQPSTPLDQYRTTGFYRGVKVSFTLIVEAAGAEIPKAAIPASGDAQPAVDVPTPKPTAPSDRSEKTIDGAANKTLPFKRIGESLIVSPADSADATATLLVEPRNVKATYAAEQTTAKEERTSNILSYADDKPDGKKSLGGSGEMIQFELPEGVTRIKGIRIHGSRYGLPQAPKEDFEACGSPEAIREFRRTSRTG